MTTCFHRVTGAALLNPAIYEEVEAVTRTGRRRCRRCIERSLTMAGTWESIKVDVHTIAEKLKAIVHEGNVRRVIVKHDGRTIAEFPLTAGVVGAVLAPVLAAVAAIAAMLKDCTLEIERVDHDVKSEPPRAAAG
jgi:hypothetical protein